jgi:membrane-bound lytic murein transglycosylase F
MLVVYRRGERRPRSFEDLAGLKIMVIADSSYEEALELARIDVPELAWEPRSDVGMEELLLAVSDGAIDATLVDSNIFNLNGGFYPRVAIGFTLPATIPHAWAFQKSPDRSLVEQAEVFIDRVKEDGTLAALQSAFYDVGDRLTRVDMRQFMSQVRDRLPPLIPMFREVADAYGLDWRLLAAMGYQESHWDPTASSYTGVRGLMMLTRRTANQLGVTDRLDPWQSIEGGARYLLQLRDRLPERIKEPDRTWMALAAYNMGMGHLEDARVLTERQGGDPDSWEDVNERLGLLTRERYYRDTRYGYARGHEARKYVANIQAYFETLVWMDTREHPLLVAQL